MSYHRVARAGLRVAAAVSVLIVADCLAEPVLQEEMLVTGTPLSEASGLVTLPYSVQSFSREDFEERAYISLADFLEAEAAGVSINHAQNNPLQPDIRVRGFTASPLLGAPQGIAVYMNGVRLNEPFGDTVNWDLVRAPFIQRMALLSGANAAYGLNALGGTLMLETRTGFSSETEQLQGKTGSFDRTEASFSSGGNNGRWGYFVALDSFREDGWRDFSSSRAENAYAALSLRDRDLTWDLYALIGDSNLHGNGAAPAALLEQDRAAVFTHPDITENQAYMLSSDLGIRLSATSRLRTMLFVRENTTDSFNGDGTEYEECEAQSGFLCDEESGQAVTDEQGARIPDEFDAINNWGQREQRSWGGTLEYQSNWQLWNRTHFTSVGVDYYRGDTVFNSRVEFAQLRADRSTTRSGRFDAEGNTALDSLVETRSLYGNDRFSLSPKSELTLSLRYNHSSLRTQDRSGERPALNSEHTFTSLNGGVGAAYRIHSASEIYASLHRSSRTPSPVELACSHPDAPCTLPNTFLADPPLEDIVANNVEVGLRSAGDQRQTWRIAAFRTDIEDDIIFQATGGVSSNEGFFSNASDTRRQGFTAETDFTIGRVRFDAQYTWLKATFRDDFYVSSPNHPAAMDGVTAVERGDELPGLPRHNVNLGFEWQLRHNLIWHLDGYWRSGVYLRGDESNQDEKTGAAKQVNMQITYAPQPDLEVYLAVENLFDWEYETFGLYGEPNEVLPNLEAENNRFLSPSPPRGAWLGFRYSW